MLDCKMEALRSMRSFAHMRSRISVVRKRCRPLVAGVIWQHVVTHFLQRDTLQRSNLELLACMCAYVSACVCVCVCIHHVCMLIYLFMHAAELTRWRHILWRRILTKTKRNVGTIMHGGYGLLSCV